MQCATIQPMEAHLQTRDFSPVVEDGILTALAALDSTALDGEFDAETQALLVTALPDICAELITWRTTARSQPATLAMALRSQLVADKIDRARLVVLSVSRTSAAELATACDTLRRYSPDPEERDAAAVVLAQIEGGAEWAS